MMSEKGVCLEWEAEALSLQDVVRYRKLPLVVKLHADDRLNFRGATRVDLSQPFLLYQTRVCLKVVASNVYWDDSQQQYRQVGHQVVIPASYPGWFMRLQDLGVSIQPLNKIEDVAKSQTGTFMCRTQITGYKPERPRDADTYIYTPVLQQPGQQFTAIDVFRQYHHRPKSLCCLTWLKAERKQIKRPNESTYLRTRAETGEDLFLLFSEEGEFYPAGQPGVANSNAAYRLLDLVSTYQVPIHAKLVHGTPPSSHCSFTGNLQIEEAYKQESVIACTMSMCNPRFIEFPSDANTKVLVAKNKQEYIRYDIFKRTAVFCAENVDSYSKSIKVAQSFTPEEDESDEDYSYYSGSEYTDDEQDIVPEKEEIVEEKKVSVERKTSVKVKRKPSRARSIDRVRQDEICEIIPLNIREKRTINIFSVKTEDQTENHPQNAQITVVNTTPTVTEAPEKHVKNYDLQNELKATLETSINKTKEEDRENIHSEPIDHLLNKIFDYHTITEGRDTGADLHLELNHLPSIPPPPEDVTPVLAQNEYFTDPNLDHLIIPPPPTESVYNHECDTNLVLSGVTEHQPINGPLTVDTNDMKPPGSAFEQYIKTSHEPVISDQTYLHDKLSEPTYNQEEEDRHLYSQSKGYGQPAIPVIPPIVQGENMDPHYSHGKEFPELTLDNNNYNYLYNLNSPNDSGVSTDRRYSDIESVSMQGSVLESCDGQWRPPVDTRSMSVAEVGQSMRYIGIKEAVVSQFATEQIDGIQLMELDELLLREAFPLLNGLERKKIIDFQNGWRPKRH